MSENLPDLPARTKPGPRPKQKRGRPSKLSLQQAQRDLNERQLQYVIWAATPEGRRSPPTAKELAAQIGVEYITLWRWAKNPKVIHAIRWMVLNNAGDPARIGRVIDILFEIAEDETQTVRARMEAAREFLGAVGVKQSWKNPTPDILSIKEVEEIDLDALTDEEVWELYNERAGNNGELGELQPGDDEVTDGEVVDVDDDPED